MIKATDSNMRITSLILTMSQSDWHRLLEAVTGCYWQLHTLTDSYRLLLWLTATDCYRLTVTGCYWLLLFLTVPDYYWLLQTVTDGYRLLLTVTELQTVTDCYRLLQAVAGCYRLLLMITNDGGAAPPDLYMWPCRSSSVEASVSLC